MANIIAKKEPLNCQTFTNLQENLETESDV